MAVHLRILKVHEDQESELLVTGLLTRNLTYGRTAEQTQANITNVRVGKPKFLVGDLVRSVDTEKLGLISFISSLTVALFPESDRGIRELGSLMGEVIIPARRDHEVPILDFQGKALPGAKADQERKYVVSTPCVPNAGRWQSEVGWHSRHYYASGSKCIVREYQLSPAVFTVCEECGEYRVEGYPCHLCGNTDGVPKWVVASLVSKSGYSGGGTLRLETFDKWVRKTVRSKFRKRMREEGLQIVNTRRTNQGVVSFQPGDYTLLMGCLIAEALEAKADFESGWVGNRHVTRNL